MLKLNATCNTAGDGYWSDKSKGVDVTEARLGYLNDESDFAELRVYFDTRCWDVNTDGLVYTDRQWIRDFRAVLERAGFTKEAVGDADYSEQGMQGDNYVSLDVGSKFLTEWFDKGEVDGN